MAPLSKKKSYTFLFIISFLAAGISNYWIIPSYEIEILNTYFLSKWVALSIGIGLISVLVLQRKIVDTATLISFGFIAAVLIRVIIDIIQDSTDHNLWPLELFLTLLIVFPTSLLGALLGTFFRKTRNSNP